MKKWFRILGALAALLIVAGAVFLATVDLDRYRPAVVRSLSQALGRAVSIDRIKLVWRGGLAAELQRLAIFPGLEASGPPAIRAQRVTAGLRLFPLLRGDLHLGAVTVLQPEAEVIRTSAGELSIPGLTPFPPAGLPGRQAGGESKGPMKAVPLFIGLLEIRDGLLRVKDGFSQPPLAVTLRKLDLTLKNVSLNLPRLEESSLDIQGVIGTMEMTTAGQPALQGQLSAVFQGSFRGVSAQEWVEGLSGQLDVQWQQLRVVGLNILREVFSKLSIVPGLLETLLERLPESYQARLAAADTVLEPGNLRLALKGGQVIGDALRLATDSFELTGSLRADLEGNVDLPAQLRVEPQLSAAMIESVKELKFLSDEQGQMVLSIAVQGRFPRLVVFPRLETLTQNLLLNHTEELIGGLLEKLLKKGD